MILKHPNIFFKAKICPKTEILYACVISFAIAYWELHDDAWWCHQMETFSVLLAICAGNSPVTGEFPTQRRVTQSFDVFFDLHRSE